MGFFKKIFNSLIDWVVIVQYHFIQKCDDAYSFNRKQLLSLTSLIRLRFGPFFRYHKFSQNLLNKTCFEIFTPTSPVSYSISNHVMQCNLQKLSSLIKYFFFSELLLVPGIASARSLLNTLNEHYLLQYFTLTNCKHWHYWTIGNVSKVIM